MPDPDKREANSTHERPPSDELVLAAVERASRHRVRRSPHVPAWAIAEHLAIPARTGRARRLRSQLERLTAAGTLERARRSGVLTWALTSAGRRRLQAARLTAQPLALPESPQHLAWRNARRTACCEIPRFRGSLRDDLEEALRVLDEDPPVHSDTWFELGQRLYRDARRLASASHCLYEWPEPQDERADIDERREPGDELLDADERARREAWRVGRRNIHLWDDHAGGS